MEIQGLIPLLQTIYPQIPASWRMEAIAGDASTRNYYRIYLNERETLVLMELDVAMQKSQTEIIAVWDYFLKHNLPVPRRYAQDPGRGLILCEDLGDETLEQALAQAAPSQVRDYYTQAVDLLLQIQAVGDQHPAPQCPIFQRALDAERFAWELSFFGKHMLEGERGIKLSPQERDELEAHFRDLARRIAEFPRVLAHRDYHSRNLMLKDGRLRLVDFQDARLALPHYDLASLLRDSYWALSDEMSENLLAYYYEKRRDASEAIGSWPEFRTMFDYACLQRNLKALGTFAYQHVGRGNPRYLQYIPRTLEYVRQNFNRHPEFSEFQRLLGRCLPEVL